ACVSINPRGRDSSDPRGGACHATRAHRAARPRRPAIRLQPGAGPADRASRLPATEAVFNHLGAGGCNPRRHARAAGWRRRRQTVTRASGAAWSGARGRLDREALRELVPDPATLCFVCGPPALVAEMPALLNAIGVPRERIRLEEWT